MDRREAYRVLVLVRATLIALVLVGSGTLVASGDDPIAPAPPPDDDPSLAEPVRTSRVRCPEENVTNVLDPIVKRGANGYVRLRVVTEYRAGLLYAHRPNDLYRSVGRDMHDGTDAPGVHHVSLSLPRGEWLLGCFGGDFSTFEHPPEHYDVIEVVRTP